MPEMLRGHVSAVGGEVGVEWGQLGYTPCQHESCRAFRFGKRREYTLGTVNL